MEIRMEPLPEEAPPADTFVSVRVGDVQKQSRFAVPRSFKFPDPGDERGQFGRIEVFKRVGHVTVRFNDLETKGHRVDVPCNWPGLEALGMKFVVKGHSTVEVPVPDKKGRAKARMDEAQQYLAEHKLEELIAGAMRDVIQAKPKDPHEFLSKRMLVRDGPTKPRVVPPPREGKPEVSPPMPEPSATLKASAPAPKAEPAVVSKAAAPAPEVTNDFQFLPSVGSWLAQQRHKHSGTAVPATKEDKVLVAKAPALAAATTLAPVSAPAATPRTVTSSKTVAEAIMDFHFLPSVGSWLSWRRTRQDIAPASGMTMPIMVPAPALATVPSTSAEASAATAPVTTTLEKDLAASSTSFRLKPSVATWYSSKPRGVKAPVEVRAPVVGLEVSRGMKAAEALATVPKSLDNAAAQSVSSYRTKPSVATWYLSKPLAKAAAPLPAVELAPAAVPASARRAPADKGFHLRPSVGTWLMLLPPKEQAAAPLPAVELAPAAVPAAAGRAPADKGFHLRPSVGTWLMLLPPKEQAAAPLPAVELASAAVPASARRAPADKGFHLRPSVGTWLMLLPPKEQIAHDALAAARVNADIASALVSEVAPSVADRQFRPPKEPFQLQPSVGTWLAPQPIELERPWYLESPAIQESDPVVSATVSKLQNLLADKDREIEDLKTQLRRSRRKRTSR